MRHIILIVLGFLLFLVSFQVTAEDWVTLHLVEDEVTGECYLSQLKSIKDEGLIIKGYQYTSGDGETNACGISFPKQEFGLAFCALGSMNHRGSPLNPTCMVKMDNDMLVFLRRYQGEQGSLDCDFNCQLQ